MKLLKITSLLIIIFSFLSNCKKEIPFDISENERKIVINGLLIPDSSICINLTKSKSIAESDYELQYISDAKVDLYENNTLVARLNHSNMGYYKDERDYRPKAGKNYKLVVEYNGQTATAEILLPENKLEYSIEIEKSRITYNNSIDSTIGSLNLYITIFDDGNDKNYYCLSFGYTTMEYVFIPPDSSVMASQLSFSEFTLYSPAVEFSDNNYQVNQDSIIKRLYGNFVYFSNDLFRGKSHKLKLQKYLYNYPAIKESKDSAMFYLYISRIEKAYFQYRKYLALYNEDDDFLTEKVQVVNNINNGLGLFSGLTNVIDSFAIAKKDLHYYNIP